MRVISPINIPIMEFKNNNFNILFGYINLEWYRTNHNHLIFLFWRWHFEFQTSNRNCHHPLLRWMLFIFIIYNFLQKIDGCSFPLILKVTLPIVQSITPPTIFKNVHPRIIDRLSFSRISSTTKYVGSKLLAIKIGTFSTMPIGLAVNLSAICKDISICINLSKSSFL